MNRPPIPTSSYNNNNKSSYTEHNNKFNKIIRAGYLTKFDNDGLSNNLVWTVLTQAEIKNYRKQDCNDLIEIMHLFSSFNLTAGINPNCIKYIYIYKYILLYIYKYRF